MTVRAIVWPTVLVMACVACATFLLMFPQNYPDKMLLVEEEIRTFLDNVTSPIKRARLSLQEPDTEIFMPVYGELVRQVGDTWQAPRDGVRTHDGQDIFADRGTPVFSGTNGYVRRVRDTELGGLNVLVTGAGGRRYYYAHLDKIADGIHAGLWVTPDTVLGFVGNTGNAVTTPPHLHFGVYEGRNALNPLPLLVDRW